MRARLRQLSYRRRRRLVLLSALVVGGGAAAAIVFLGPNKNAPPERFDAEPVRAPVQEKTVPLPHGWRHLALTFIGTAVTRADLPAAWKIVGPNLRGGLTYEQWLTGNIPVIPYSVTSLRDVYLKTDYSYRDNVLVEVWFPPPAKAQSKEAESFYLHLKRVGEPGHKRWLVDGWVART